MINNRNIAIKQDSNIMLYKYLFASALIFILMIIGGCSHTSEDNAYYHDTSALDYVSPHQGPAASTIMSHKLENNRSGKPHIPPSPEPTTTEKAIQNGMLGISIIRVLATPFTLPIP